MGTFNVNGRRPPADLDLRPWLDMATHQADIVAVGFQEVVPLNAGNVMMGMQHTRMMAWIPITLLACMPMYRMVDTAAYRLSLQTSCVKNERTNGDYLDEGITACSHNTTVRLLQHSHRGVLYCFAIFIKLGRLACLPPMVAFMANMS